MKKYRGVFLKNEREIGLLREANKIVSRILDALGEAVRPGLKTMYFEEMAQAMCREYNVRPGFQGYGGFPYALCCSINEEIVHGFPSDRVLQEGDIVTFDMGVVYEGFNGDSARTFPVGTVSDETARLLTVTRESLYKGIEQARHGNGLLDISRAVQTHAENAGFGVVRNYVGHGIGCKLHEKPEVPNYVPEGHPDLPLQTGMVICIEPMITAGSYEAEVLPDGWTAVTKDRKYAAHFEHCIAITSNGPVILSQS